MKPSRTTRLVAALVAVISLLFTQLALASYVCPGMGSPDRMMAMAAVDSTQEMSNCAGMDSQQPGLCHAQDHAVQQSLDKPEVPQVPAFMAAGPVLIVLAAVIAEPAAAVLPDLALLTRATAPPLAIRHCCFRI